MPARIAIIGAGLGGVALGVKLKRAGIHSFTLFEKSKGPGGTWWDNTYPGAGSDVPAHLYSYSFMTYDWERTHPSHREMQRYVEAVIEKFELRPHLRYEAGVRSAVWDETAHRYTIELETGERHDFDVVVSAVGMLNVPKYPDWPGLDELAATKFHSARWRHDVDLTGRRVAVVGTGSTAAQLVPAIAPMVGKLYVFQREPGWVAPKAEREFSAEERRRFRRWPILQRYQRLRLFWTFERFRASSNAMGAAHEQLQARCEQHIHAAIADPELRAKVTPTHGVFCKRPILSNTYYPALTRPNVELVPHAVVRATRTGLVDDTGAERAIDVLVMATGFRAADYLSTIEVVGRDGRSLHAAWNQEPSAFLGLAVPGFPNFFMMYGPGTNGGSIIFKLEQQADWIVRVVKRLARAGTSAVEVKQAMFQRFNAWLDERNGKMAWRGGCNNYFTSPTGRIVTQWPGSQGLYWLMSKALNRIAMRSLGRPEPRSALNDESAAATDSPKAESVTSIARVRS